jgi:hypothetical protein
MNHAIRYRPRTETRRIILHDSHTTPELGGGALDVPRWADQAKEGGLKMGLLSTGYHIIKKRDGTMVTARQWDLVGTHTPGHNMDSIGYCLVGGREHYTDQGVDNFTDEQIKTLFAFVVLARVTFMSDIELVGHTEVQSYHHRDRPRCPPLDMEDLRQSLNIYLTTGELIR